MKAKKLRVIVLLNMNALHKNQRIVVRSGTGFYAKTYSNSHVFTVFKYPLDKNEHTGTVTDIEYTLSLRINYWCADSEMLYMLVDDGGQKRGFDY